MRNNRDAARAQYGERGKGVQRAGWAPHGRVAAQSDHPKSSPHETSAAQATTARPIPALSAQIGEFLKQALYWQAYNRTQIPVDVLDKLCAFALCSVGTRLVERFALL